MDKVKVAIVGPGNIGTDLMMKVLKSDYLEMSAMIGVVDSPGIQRAREMGFIVTTEGISYLEKHPDLAEIVFDATSAKVHEEINAPVLKKLDKYAIDLTPAAVGPLVSPIVNMQDALSVRNVNVITCAGQAGTPIIKAITDLIPIKYVELVSCSASKGVGRGSRLNNDEFVATTGRAYCQLGGAASAKVVPVIQPAVPEVNMRNTLYLVPEDGYEVTEELLHKIRENVDVTVKKIQEYVPGYELTFAPVLHASLDGTLKYITLCVSVEGAGDFLPKYAGNLDIMTSSAIKIAEEYAKKYQKGELAK